MNAVSGVGKDAPTIVNDAGGKQSGSPYRMDLLPPLALLAVAEVLKHGADKYGAENWRKIPVGDHLNHAMTHAYAYLAGDTQDDHLAHAACRILFALELKLAAGLRDSRKPGGTRVYIAGPISNGDLGENIDQASVAFFELLKHGLAPFCPHWSAFAGPVCRGSRQVGDKPWKHNQPYSWAETLPRGTRHTDWLNVDLLWVEVADAVLRLPGESAGADREIEHAAAKGIPVFHSIAEVVAWAVQH